MPPKTTDITNGQNKTTNNRTKRPKFEPNKK
jgi:hypothetical protein